MNIEMTSACVLLIGNEILSGRTKDKNLSYIAEKLNQYGVRVLEARVIPDIESEIIETINTCRVKFDYVFTTGGIGPTHDDITCSSVAKALNLKVIRHPEAEAQLREYYGEERTNDARLSMADVPEGATLIPNPISIAPGFTIENVYVLAGVPSICQAMIDYVAPTLKGGSPMQAIAYDVNKAEGDIAAVLNAIQEAYASLEIGVYPRYIEGKLSSHVVLRGNDEVVLKEASEKLKSQLESEFSATLNPVV